MEKMKPIPEANERNKTLATEARADEAPGGKLWKGLTSRLSWKGIEDLMIHSFRFRKSVVSRYFYLLYSNYFFNYLNFKVLNISYNEVKSFKSYSFC